MEVNNQEVDPKENKVIEALSRKLGGSVESLSNANDFSRSLEQDKVFQFVRELIRHEGGIAAIYKHISELTRSGIFVGGGWEKEDRLNPQLARGSLLANGIYPTLEILSELRIVAIANGDYQTENMNSEEAKKFLLEVMALNLSFLFQDGALTEEERVSQSQFQSVRSLFLFLKANIDVNPLFGEVIREARELTAQRSINTLHIKRVLRSAKNLVDQKSELKKHKDYSEFIKYYDAIYFNSPLSRKCGEPSEYRLALKEASAKDVEKECEFLGGNLNDNGLTGKNAAVLVRVVAKKYENLMPTCLGLSEIGTASYENNKEFLLSIINLAIKPSTHNTIYGLTCFINREIISQKEVRNGIRKLVDIDIDPLIKKQLLQLREHHDSITPNAILVSGLISVLGQPLGVSQGSNPTCQSARGISLWSQHDPGYLIDVLLTAARNNLFECKFEGSPINSQSVLIGPNLGINNQDLDPVSIVLSPHLDAVYGEILKRAAIRGDDAHKWANPSLYGRFVPNGFLSVLDLHQRNVTDYENFVRHFFATHHPDYMEDAFLTYANPVGIFITSSHADLIGLHAVSIQRIRYCEVDKKVRVYFFNPNREGRQNWGQGISPSVCGHSEKPGESSLPFDEFTSRLYAFHFNPYEEGDGFGVPDKVINHITELSKTSWGRVYHWLS